MRVAKELATEFVQHKQQKHGDLWVVLTLDNLSVHVAEHSKKILLIYFTSQTTEHAQPIDVGHGRSIRCRTGNLVNR